MRKVIWIFPVFVLFVLFVAACDRPASSSVTPIDVNQVATIKAGITQTAFALLPTPTQTPTSTRVLASSPTPEPEIADLAQGAWGHESAVRMLDLGIIEPCATNPVRICPDNSVNETRRVQDMYRWLESSQGIKPILSAPMGYYLDQGNEIPDEVKLQYDTLRALGYLPRHDPVTGKLLLEEFLGNCQPSYINEADRYACPSEETLRDKMLASASLLLLGPQANLPLYRSDEFRDLRYANNLHPWIFAGLDAGLYPDESKAELFASQELALPELFDNKSKGTVIQWIVLLDKAYQLSKEETASLSLVSAPRAANLCSIRYSLLPQDGPSGRFSKQQTADAISKELQDGGSGRLLKLIDCPDGHPYFVDGECCGCTVDDGPLSSQGPWECCSIYGLNCHDAGTRGGCLPEPDDDPPPDPATQTPVPSSTPVPDPIPTGSSGGGDNDPKPTVKPTHIGPVGPPRPNRLREGDCEMDFVSGRPVCRMVLARLVYNKDSRNTQPPAPSGFYLDVNFPSVEDAGIAEWLHAEGFVPPRLNIKTYGGVISDRLFCPWCSVSREEAAYWVNIYFRENEVPNVEFVNIFRDIDGTHPFDLDITEMVTKGRYTIGLGPNLYDPQAAMLGQKMRALLGLPIAR